MENVIPIPHLGASTQESEENCAVMIASQIRDFIENGNVKNSVNYPEAKLERTSKFRLIVLNKNIPNMVGQLSTMLAGPNINIAEMLNKSKGGYAYNIIDLSDKPNAAVVMAWYNIKGILMVRIIGT